MGQAAVQKKEPNADDKKVMDAMLIMIHSLLTATELFFKHKSISDLGPFTLVINGIRVLKVSFMGLSFNHLSQRLTCIYTNFATFSFEMLKTFFE
jgi:hypothetical protein